MEKMLKLFVSLLLIQDILAGVITEKYYKDPGHYGKCVVNGQVLSPGQSIKHPELPCARFTCETSLGLATIQTCKPLVSPLMLLAKYDPDNPPDCVWNDDGRHLALPFPDCCWRNYICDFNISKTEKPKTSSPSTF